jgi:hypothetical protein
MATKPWSVINDDELKLLREVARECGGLQRGCDCEYDYRCGRCSQILHVKELAEQAKVLR